MQRETLITAIEAHSIRFGVAPATITSRAVGNSRLYDRLKGGGDCTTTIAAKIISFIEGDATRRSPDPGASSVNGAA